MILNIEISSAGFEGVEARKRSYLFALLAVLIWSTVASAFKLALRYMDPIELLFLSTISSLCVIGAVLVVRGELRSLSFVTRKQMLGSMLMGLLNPFLYYLVLFSAYDLLRAQEAQAVNYTWPLMLTILSVVFLKQRIGWRSILALLVSFAGVLLVISRGDLAGLKDMKVLGVLLGLSSALIWAVYWTMNLKDRRRAAPKLFLNFLFGAIPVTVLTVLHGIGLPQARGLAASIYIGAFEMGLTFIIWYLALKASGSTARVSNLIYLTPFLSLVLIWIVVGEAMIVWTVLGLVLIVAGIIIQNLDRERSAPGTGRTSR